MCLFSPVLQYSTWYSLSTRLKTAGTAAKMVDMARHGVYNNANRIGKPPAPPGAGQKVFKTLP